MSTDTENKGGVGKSAATAKNGGGGGGGNRPNKGKGKKKGGGGGSDSMNAAPHPTTTKPIAKEAPATANNHTGVGKASGKSGANDTTPTPATSAIRPKRAVDPPRECSRDDFCELLIDARGLSSRGEALGELLECARYGEVDAVRAILDVWVTGGVAEVGGTAATTTPPGGDGGGDPNDAATDAGASELLGGAFVDGADSSGSTALHKACANGHSSTAALLLSRGARHGENGSGNTPLHWCAAAGRADVSEMLLAHYDSVGAGGGGGSGGEEKREGGGDDGSASKSTWHRKLDVLRKNAVGRSALTEAFASGDTATVGVLLNHDSAEEERLIGGMGGKEVDADAVGGMDEAKGDSGADVGTRENGRGEGADVASDDSPPCVVHEFDFRSREDEDSSTKRAVLVRELPIAHADDPFGDSAIDDTTGLGIWCASLVMARWMASPEMVARMDGSSVLELGAGCGVPGLSTAVYGQPKSVFITDLNPETVRNARHNVELNERSVVGTCQVSAGSIDWGDASTYPSEKLDFVIGSDLIYQKEIGPLLKKVVTGLLREVDDNVLGGTFLYVAPEGGRDGLSEFIDAMKGEGFECVSEKAAPNEYRENPLGNGDEEECFLHFHELASTEYVLYEFSRTR